MAQTKDIIKDLVLILLYLTSWEEKGDKSGTEKYHRSWKTYNWDAIDALAEEDYIYGSYKAKSVMISEEGCKKAEELLKAYGVDR
ncbi:MAG: DUF6429 family protein [Spirochaetaceae bacterium]|jgi:hypothetical protein|nr:DUF6429 family protein [Spirochaetaceae bacterium]